MTLHYHEDGPDPITDATAERTGFMDKAPLHNLICWALASNPDLHSNRGSTVGFFQVYKQRVQGNNTLSITRGRVFGSGMPLSLSIPAGKNLMQLDVVMPGRHLKTTTWPHHYVSSALWSTLRRKSFINVSVTQRKNFWGPLCGRWNSERYHNVGDSQIYWVNVAVKRGPLLLKAAMLFLCQLS